MFLHFFELLLTANAGNLFQLLNQKTLWSWVLREAGHKMGRHEFGSVHLVLCCFCYILCWHILIFIVHHLRLILSVYGSRRSRRTNQIDTWNLLHISAPWGLGAGDAMCLGFQLSDQYDCLACQLAQTFPVVTPEFWEPLGHLLRTEKSWSRLTPWDWKKFSFQGQLKQRVIHFLSLTEWERCHLLVSLSWKGTLC